MLNTTTRSSKAPTHEIFAVRRDSDKPDAKGYWRRIGAAWPHKDGDGFNLKFEMLPLDGSEMVIRKWKPKPESDGEIVREAFSEAA